MALSDITVSSAINKIPNILGPKIPKPKDILSEGLHHYYKSSPSKESFFDVLILPPAEMVVDAYDFKNGKHSKHRDLKFSCEATELPGRMFQLSPTKVYGVIEHQPTMTFYNIINLTFVCHDKNFYEKQFFDSWMNYISQTNEYNFKYRSEYASTIKIFQYSSTGDKIYECTLNQIFPFATNQLNLNWESSGFHKLIVSFAYTNWEGKSFEAAEPKLDQSFNFGNIVRAAETGFTIYNAAKTFSKSPLTSIGVAASALPNFGQFNLSTLSKKIK